MGFQNIRFTLHLIHNYFRKDNIIFDICIYITFIGSLIIVIKKIISRQMIQRIPKSNILPHPTKYLEQFFPMETLHSTPKIIQVRRISQSNAIGIVTQVHKVDITEGASAQFPTSIFNFRSYGQLKAVRKKIIGNYFYYLLLGVVFMCIFFKYCSVSSKQ